jgi:hypothetical protein
VASAAAGVLHCGRGASTEHFFGTSASGLEFPPARRCHAAAVSAPRPSTVRGKPAPAEADQ